MRLGLRTHWRDAEAAAALARRHGASVLEYAMRPGDLEAHAEAAFEAFLPVRGEFELRVRAPPAVLDDAGRLTLLDVSSPDPAARARSVEALGEVARHAMEMRAKALLVHPSGVWRPGEVGGSAALLRASLEDLPRHVPLLLTNVPALYALGGLGLPDGHSPAGFRIPAGLGAAGDLVDGYVLDVAGAYLAAENGSLEVARALVRALGPRVRHVHASGARAGMGDAGRGTPFRESDYDADHLRELLAAVPGDAVVVPTVPPDHLDDAVALLRSL